MDMLACPTHKVRLELTKTEPSNEKEITRGRLKCPQCKTEFAIENGIPDLRPRLVSADDHSDDLAKNYEKDGFFLEEKRPPWIDLLMTGVRGTLQKSIKGTGENFLLLDVGTGGSLTLYWLLKTFEKIFALSIDIRPSTIASSQSILSRKGIPDRSYDYALVDATEMGLFRNQFDIVSAALSVHEMSKKGSEYEKIGKCVGEMVDVCVDQGSIFVLDMETDARLAKEYRHRQEEIEGGDVSFPGEVAMKEFLEKRYPNSYKVGANWNYVSAGGTSFYLISMRKLPEDLSMLMKTMERTHTDIVKRMLKGNVELRGLVGDSDTPDLD
jgi:uncharacterized protein YbaR (Trm112 family)/ubiquinone/menaquinone biosynthesis C-methylase UbiE